MFHLLCNFASRMTAITQNVLTRHYSDCEMACYAQIALEDLKRFIADCFCTFGASESNSDVLAEAIVQADCRGVLSEGISRIDQYIKDIEDCICDPKAEPKVEEEFTSVAVVNGNNGFGPVVGKFSMEIAMEKALGTGIGMVAARESNYFGMASLYTLQAAKKGFIGLSFSNGVPLMVPPDGKNAALGANPLSLAAPAHCDGLVFDMSTTAVTLSKINDYRLKKLPLPHSWAKNKKGEVEENALKALEFKRLSPFGGDMAHKGFGLGLVVEILSGVLADANYGPKVPIVDKACHRRPLNLGHGFIAINPEKFVPNFATRMTKFLNLIRSGEPANAEIPISVPGDRSRMNIKKVNCDGGICYTRNQIRILERLANKLGVQPVTMSILDNMFQQRNKKC